MTEERICKNCKGKFVIEPEDFQFYEKIKVPPPTWCPECRQRRRYAWRNERVLYRRTCDLCGKSTVTIYSQNKPFKVYCPPCWWSDKWDAGEFARDIDFSRPFFEQFRELQLQVPRIALLSKNSVNSDYTNHSNDNKNCYLTFSTFDSENILYSTNVWKRSKDCMDCYLASDEGGAEFSYECIDSFNIYNCQYGNLIRNCSDCFYCFDCRGCSDCFLSVNLRNKKYCILNEQYTKEEYQKKIAEYRLGSYAVRTKLYEEFRDLMRKKAIHRYAVIERSTDVSGNMVVNSKNAHRVFDGSKTEDVKYAIVCPDVKSSMDSYHYGHGTEIVYESHALIFCYNVLFTHLSYHDSNLQYCDSCHDSENLFGCVGVRKGSYQILNKAYTLEEYERLTAQLIEHMKRTGEYGEFFPPKLSPFGYNETQGNIYMPMTKDQALAAGYQWEDLMPGTFGKETTKPEDIPDNIADVSDDITKAILRCVECGKNYNIVAPELTLYRQQELPIPRQCPDCRYRSRIGLRQPRNLWHRSCACAGSTSSPQVGRKSEARSLKSETSEHQNTTSHFHNESLCPNEFETSYAPDRPEIVYCESCYNSEVV